jgi:hypothetical protein
MKINYLGWSLAAAIGLAVGLGTSWGAAVVVGLGIGEVMLLVAVRKGWKRSGGPA